MPPSNSLSRSVMLVVAGPAGSGKSRVFPVAESGFDAFNVDDLAARIHGSYRDIPPSIRAEAGAACEAFVRTHIVGGVSFAVETTLRTEVSIDQARAARSVGFVTVLVFVGTADVSVNIERIRRRGLAGGHSAPPALLEAIYEASLANLRRALGVFDVVRLFDNSSDGVGPVAEVAQVYRGIATVRSDAPAWVLRALEGTPQR